MSLRRRAFLNGLVGLGLLALWAPAAPAHRGRHHHPHGAGGGHRRRRTRRRIRRRAFWRTVGGRRWLIVPVGVAAGWELAYGGRVVVVKEVQETHIVVAHDDGRTERIDVVVEDTPENTEELEGSETDDDE